MSAIVKPSFRYQKPYTPKKPGIPMTIAAAFVCNNGVVLGADMEVTRSAISKTYESKTLGIHSKVDVYLTYCGGVDYVRELIERVRDASGITHNPVDVNLKPDECFSLLKDFYQADMEKELEKPPENVQWTELLVAVRRDMYHLHKAEYEYRTTVYHLNGNSVVPVDRYAAIGIGADIAHAVFGPIYNSWSGILEASFDMIDALRRVKATGPGCGGCSTVMTIANYGDHPIDFVPSDEILQIESDCEFLDENLRFLYRWMSSPGSKQRFNKNISLLRKRLTERRATPGRLTFPSVS
jgi:20S proteasome alpha/beta subunit